MTTERKKSKPGKLIVPSDDCAVIYAGQTYYPHVGETVTIRPRLPVSAFAAFELFRQLSVNYDEKDGDADQAQHGVKLINDAFQKVVGILADRIVEWTWTDDEDERLEQPHDRPDIIEALDSQEVVYLMTIVQGESTETRKKDSGDSETGSSAIVSPETQATRPSVEVPSP